eukprot:941552-Pelagomonas_calceolata.AAC.1
MSMDWRKLFRDVAPFHTLHFMNLKTNQISICFDGAFTVGVCAEVARQLGKFRGPKTGLSGLGVQLQGARGCQMPSPKP